MGTPASDPLPALLKKPDATDATPAPAAVAPRRPMTSFLMNYSQPTYPGRVTISYFWISRLPQGGTIKVRVG